MGSKLSTVKSPYCLIGITTNKYGAFNRFLTTNRERIYVNGHESEVMGDDDHSIHYVSKGAFIVSVKVQGAKTKQDLYGEMTIIDSYQQTFRFPCKVLVSDLYQDDPSAFSTEYSAPAPNMAISSIGLGVTVNGLTVLTDMESRIMPITRNMKPDGAGWIGYLIDSQYKSLIGLISDHNTWFMFSETVFVNPATTIACYFFTGFLLSSIRYERSYKSTSIFTSDDKEQLGFASIHMTVINAEKRSLVYTCKQSHVLPVNNVFISVGSDDQVIDSFDYLVVPGYTSIEMDFLLQNAHTKPYTSPDLKSYGKSNHESGLDVDNHYYFADYNTELPTSDNSDNNTVIINNQGNMLSYRELMWVLLAMGLIVVLCYILYIIYLYVPFDNGHDHNIRHDHHSSSPSTPPRKRGDDVDSRNKQHDTSDSLAHVTSHDVDAFLKSI